MKFTLSSAVFGNLAVSPPPKSALKSCELKIDLLCEDEGEGSR